MTLAASCNNRVYLFESQFVSDIFLAAGRRIAPTSVEDEVEFRLVAEYSVNDDDYTEGATSYGLTTAAGVGGEADVGEVGAGSGNIVMMGWISDTVS